MPQVSSGSSREIIAGTAYYPGSMPAANHHAIELYLRLGFKAVRMVTLHQISRKAEFTTAED
jgi:hypothetical protein